LPDFSNNGGGASNNEESVAAIVATVASRSGAGPARKAGAAASGRGSGEGAGAESCSAAGLAFWGAGVEKVVGTSGTGVVVGAAAGRGFTTGVSFGGGVDAWNVEGSGAGVLPAAGADCGPLVMGTSLLWSKMGKFEGVGTGVVVGAAVANALLADSAGTGIGVRAGVADSIASTVNEFCACVRFSGRAPQLNAMRSASRLRLKMDSRNMRLLNFYMKVIPVNWVFLH
jgi:hypothetical protein